ncbi:hypothetical protein C7377_0238 [Balneicella halophila]|uniref:Flavoprotein n=1 Tax=Balneicella halophila TaxID=1537566 RepID=A0A7L4USI5_BALHA|nr:NAD(P)/FAD-dependent oxidoreductase [Balneicella halophila]PVX51944.1 hypothetical protein C7377_0238 [Balneicella halophila]
MNKVLIIGGGAAGFFTAINAKENNPSLDITILEKGKEVLQKVKLSGGGRCNVTHACFEPQELVKFYPRGEKELLGPFHQFMTGDTFEWFEKRGVPLKIESDNRVFPKANTSQAILDCLHNAIHRLNIQVLRNQGVTKIHKHEHRWVVTTKVQQFVADYLVITSGSSRKTWDLCKVLGHSIVDPVPSLFTFNIKDKRIKELLGVSVPNAKVKLADTSIENSGALLITHWGMSGPAILKLSAFGARFLAERNYKHEVEVNWLGEDFETILDRFYELKTSQAKKQLSLKSPFNNIPRRLWERLSESAKIKSSQNWGDITKHQIQNLATELTRGIFHINGRTIFKDEFVTAGGVDLQEINFKRFESKVHKNLFFAGEVLNIDAITGGFNFQNAWTGGYIVAKSIASDA